MPDITSKEIKGINLKQIVSYTIGVIGVALIYYDLRQNTVASREVFQEYKISSEVRMTSIEQAQRLMDIRLTIVETQMKNK